MVASADEDEVVEVALNTGRESEATRQMEQEREVSTGPERQQEFRGPQQQCSVNFLEQERNRRALWWRGSQRTPREAGGGGRGAGGVWETEQ